MWTRSHLHAFLKVPPFSPSDCASLFALNEASRLEFGLGANFCLIWKAPQVPSSCRDDFALQLTLHKRLL